MLTWPTQPKEALSPGDKDLPGRTHQIGNILLACSLLRCRRQGEGRGGYRPEPRPGGRQSQSRGESGLGSAGQRASKGQHQMRLSSQPRARMSARASGQTRGQKGGHDRRDVKGLQWDGWLPGGLTTGGRAGPTQSQPPGPEKIGCTEFIAQLTAFMEVASSTCPKIASLTFQGRLHILMFWSSVSKSKVTPLTLCPAMPSARSTFPYLPLIKPCQSTVGVRALVQNKLQDAL